MKQAIYFNEENKQFTLLNKLFNVRFTHGSRSVYYYDLFSSLLL